MENFNDQQDTMSRTFFAQPPSKIGDLKEPIKCQLIESTYTCEEVAAAIKLIGSSYGLEEIFVCRKSMKGRSGKLGKESPKVLICYLTPDWIPLSQVEDWIELARIRDGVSPLHSYMAPTEIMLLNEFPYDEYGNIDERALETPSHGMRDSYIPPPPGTCTDIANIIGDLVNYDIISIDIDIFEVGITSLLAGKLAAAVRKKSGVNVGVQDIFAYRTIKDLASFVDSKLSNKTTTVQTTPYYPKAVPQTSFWPLLVQLVPLVLLYPVQRVCAWILFLLLFSRVSDYVNTVNPVFTTTHFTNATTNITSVASTEVNYEANTNYEPITLRLTLQD